MAFSRKINSATSWMVYGGTFLLSVLSYFTTYYGLAIILDTPLAIVGSLGLQISMLGVAWSLMHMKENRKAYISLFCVASIFSIFFSYVNFDHKLNESTRINSVRKEYYISALPMMKEYSQYAAQAAMKGRYQVERLNDILEMEKKHGWGTYIDEGSGDKFIQSVIEGARKTTESWKARLGRDYKQGKGSGIIVNYLKSRIRQSEQILTRVTKYVTEMETLSREINSEMIVEDQHWIINKAWVDFPINEIALLTSEKVEIQNPPYRASYIEKAETKQQAFLMVINDLLAFDKLALFSLFLAFAIDFMIILTAFAGSYIINDEDYLLERIKQDSVRRLKDISLDDSEALSKFLAENIDNYRRASQYGQDIKTLMGEYDSGKMSKIVLVRGHGVSQEKEVKS